MKLVRLGFFENLTGKSRSQNRVLGGTISILLGHSKGGVHETSIRILGLGPHRSIV